MDKITLILILYISLVCGEEQQQTQNPENAVNTDLNSIKKIEEQMLQNSNKINLIEKEITEIKNRLDFINEEILKINTSNQKDKLTIENISSLVDGFKIKFDIMEDEIKVKMDDIKSLREMFSMLKKNMEKNIEDTVECKKAIKELQEAKNIEKPGAEDILKWQYWGITAGGIAFLAIVLAIVK